MAVPSYIAASTGATDTVGAWTATCHAPGAAGRVIVLQVLQDGATWEAVTFTSATNIEDLAGTDNQMTYIGTFNCGGTTLAAVQHVWIGRSLSTSAPTFTGANSTSQDVFWRFYEFDGVSASTSLSSVIECGDSTASAWTQASSAGFAATIVYDVAYLSGTWVGVGASGKIRYASDPRGTWTSAASPGFSTSAIYGVAAAGTTWVAVGGSGKIGVATDPTGTWTQASSPGFGTSIVYGVATDATTWVAVGASGKIGVTTDPTGTWTQASSPGFGVSNVNGVATDGTTWVAVGGNGQVRYTTDPGGTWTAASSPGFSTSAVNSVTTDGTTWVAVADGGKIRYTTDPTGTWSAASSPGFGATNVNGVATDGTTWVAVGGAGKIGIATDPTGTWTQVVSTGFASEVVYGVATDDTTWVAVGDDGDISSPAYAMASAGTSTTIAATDVTTSGTDRLAVQLVVVNDDNAVGAFTGESGGDWAEAVAEYAEAGGTQACLQLQTASMAAAGTISGGSYTMVDSDAWGAVGFALKPKEDIPEYLMRGANWQDAVSHSNVW